MRSWSRLLPLSALLAACSESGLKVQNEPPEVHFTSPADGADVAEGEALVLVASVVDLESSSEDLEYSWTLSDGSYLLGEQTVTDRDVALVLADGLSEGDVQITLQVVDPLGEADEDTLSLHVQGDAPPTVAFEAPADGEQIPFGSLVQVVIVASDAETDDLQELSLSWGGVAADASGVPTSPDSSGNASFYLEDLSEGESYVSVEVMDPSGQSATASVAFEIVNADQDGDGHDAESAGGDDCDDEDTSVHPDAQERCDAADVDEDCDGLADDADPSADPSTMTETWADADADAYGDPATSALACDPPADRVSDDTDCDDSAPSVNPSATEVCNSVDDDCDGLVDDADDSVDISAERPTYADTDGDGYGDPTTAERACDPSSDRVSDDTDCDDGAASVNPGATEVCNSVDDDCDDLVDDADPSLDVSAESPTYTDADGDGYGDPATAEFTCDGGADRVADSSDCDDGDDGVHPDADEHCDDLDEDCDGLVDEDAVDGTSWSYDDDGDGYGSASAGTTSCDTTAPAGSVDDASDCDDDNEHVYPGAPELCDGLQNDCDEADWTDGDEAGSASWESASGAWTDFTSSLAAGTTSSPAAVTLSSAGTLYVCSGTWYVSLMATTTGVSIIGPAGAEDTILSGASKTGDVVALWANSASLYIEGVTIRDGYGCYPGLNAVKTVKCSSSGSSGTDYTSVDITVVDSVITENVGYFNYSGVTLAGTSTSRNTITFIDTEVSYNSSIYLSGGVFLYYSDATCIGSSSTKAGFWGNEYGVYVHYKSTLTSDSCDWGTGSEDNDTDVVNPWASPSTYTDYGDDESFYCDSSSCR